MSKESVRTDESVEAGSEQQSGTAVDSVDMPRKSVDESASLQDRLTDNVVNRIGPARYFNKDESGDIVEDWDDVFDRVAQNVAEAEYKFGGGDRHVSKWKRNFESAMRELRFIPNTPTIASAGTELQMLSACFVLSPGDSMESIMETNKQWGLVEKDGGGMGGAFYNLRPKGALVKSTGGTSSGPLPFIDMFDSTGGSIKQGSIRSGAQMAIMHSHHADVGRFCVAKREEGVWENFNISVAVTDEFIEAVERDESYTFYNVDDLGPGSRETPQKVLPETKHFYDPEYEDAWNDETDQPGVGIDGKVVETNLWRDFGDEIDGIGQYRDQIDLEVGESMELPARFIWQLIIDGAWNNGEPGVFHIDESDREHSFDTDEHPEHFQYATNPCAEQMLCEGEACNLGHINLSLMVDPTAPLFDEFCEDHAEHFDDTSDAVSAYLNRALDGAQFEETIRTGTRFLDNVVTQSVFPIDEISREVRSKRKIGFGLMGFAQMLVQMGVEYGSDASYDVAREIMRRIDSTSTEYSHALAEERDPFPDYEESKWSDPASYPEWFETHAHENPSDHEDGYPVRNHSQTTIAPTGTSGRVGNTTGGCEPIYNTVFFKNVSQDIQGDEMLVVFDDYLERVLQANGIDVDYVENEATRLMSENEFDSIGDVDVVPEEIDDLFVTSEDLDEMEHIKMQVAFQEHCSSGISKTINAPVDATRNDISDALLYGLQNGVKGTTVYRQGSREEQVNTTRLDNRQFSDEERDEILDTVEALVEDDETAREQLDELLNGGDQ